MRVVAEWGQTNQGSVKTAVTQARVAAREGCWGAKWQLLDPAKLASPTALAYWAHARDGELQADTFTANGMVDYGAWREVKEECDNLGVEFLATPFDLGAVEALADLGVQWWKIASGDITYRDLLLSVGSERGNVFLSTGAAGQDEIARAFDWLAHARVVVPLACDLVYPCPDDEANLSRITTLIRLYGAAGYSDHTAGTYTGLAAAALGASVLEKHATLDPAGPTPDDEMGLDPANLGLYVVRARMGDTLRGSQALGCSIPERAAHRGARRAWHAAVDLVPGDVVYPWDLEALRPCLPGTVGVEAEIAGMVMVNPVGKGEPLRPGDLRPEGARSVSTAHDEAPRG